MGSPAIEQATAERASGDTGVATIESLNHDARGVARVNGKVTFIEGALPGESVRFRYLNRRKSYDNAVLLDVLTPSPDRIAPRCPHFGVCGGCSLQHLRLSAQLAAKQRVLADSLGHIGKVEPETWLAPLAGQEWGYRRRARLGVRLVPKKGGVLVGFRERRRSFVTNLSECPVLEDRVSRLLPGLRALIAGLSCPDRIPQIEVAVADNTIALVFRHLVALVSTDLEQLSAFGERHGLQIYLQGAGPDSVAPLSPRAPEALCYRLPEQDVTIRFGPADFVQVNGEVNRQMVAQALKLLELKPADRVLDLFCGLGNFTLPLARRCQQVLGIEADGTAVAAARANAALNAIANVEFRVGNLYDEGARQGPWDEFQFDKLLLDPPRSGAIEVLKRLRAPLPRRIVYVSCSPATLARDAEYLVHALGYRLVAAGVMDMFPHTSHVESMAVFVQS
jgi:23S rRNA (uracil1939-C5)-methyltransferase